MNIECQIPTRLQNTLLSLSNVARQLKDPGEKISDIVIMAKIIGSVPTKFYHFVSTWDSVAPENQTLANLTQRLLMEENRSTSVLATLKLSDNKNTQQYSRNKHTTPSGVRSSLQSLYNQ